MKILLLGLDGAGKTSILLKLSGHENAASMEEVIPTIGFNLETFRYQNLIFNAWDVGGQDLIRKLWKHYFKNANAIIFVVDAADRSRLGQAAEELRKMLRDSELKDAALLILANKQDLEGAINPQGVIELMGLRSMKELTKNQRRVCVKPTCAVTGEGLDEAMKWLAEVLPLVEEEKNNKLDSILNIRYN